MNDYIPGRIRRFFPLMLVRKLPREIRVVRIDAQTSRRLNRRYLDRDHAANVLSFRYGERYGEILICFSIVRREADRCGHGFDYQMTWMILHGMLHLAGVHHTKSRAAARRFEKLERDLLTQFYSTSKARIANR